MMKHGYLVLLFCLVFIRQHPAADDYPQWGKAWGRNMVSQEVGLPDGFDIQSGKKLRWTAELGTETHGTPVVADGRVYIGTNNGNPKNPLHQGDRGVLMCFDEGSGAFLWQLVVPKRDEDPYFDWPHSGISSPATVEGDRVYLVSNRGEVICLDAHGMENGNQGPFQEEAQHASPDKETAVPVGPTDADILWLFNLTHGAGIWSHDAAHSSILIQGDHLYLNTGTGVDNTHRRIRTPDAPSLVVLDKHSGKYLARETEGNAVNIFHCTWSAPSLGKVGSDPRLFFVGGDGILYGYDLVDASYRGGDPVLPLNRVWRFDLDPSAPKEDVHRYHKNTRTGPSNVFGMPVFEDGRLYVAGGGDLWWGKTEAWIQCIDVFPGEGAPRKDPIWQYQLNRHVMATPCVYNDLVFIADCGKVIHCIDKKNGVGLWTHETGAAFWASAFAADGKIYIGNRSGEFFIFEASPDKNLLFSHDFHEPISATTTVANGTVYIATMSKLHAIRQEAGTALRR